MMEKGPNTPKAGTIGNNSGTILFDDNQGLKGQNRLIVPVPESMYIREKKGIVAELCYLLEELCPAEITKNRITEYDELLDEWPDRDRSLFNLLVHVMTKLHRRYRIKDQGVVYTEKEDVFISLELLGPSMNPSGFMSRYDRQRLREMKSYFGQSVFTRNELQSTRRISKSQANRILSRLFKKGVLARGHYPNKGYRYQVIK